MVGGCDENEENGMWNHRQALKGEIPRKKEGVDLGRGPKRFPFSFTSLSIDKNCFPGGVRLAKYLRGFEKMG